MNAMYYLVKNVFIHNKRQPIPEIERTQQQQQHKTNRQHTDPHYTKTMHSSKFIANECTTPVVSKEVSGGTHTPNAPDKTRKCKTINRQLIDKRVIRRLQF